MIRSHPLTVAVPDSATLAAQFRADVLRGLGAARKAIPCKYFYDEAGSELFERLCALDEYYLTRTELAIMRQHAQGMAELIGPACVLIEYGSGSSLKTRLLLDRLERPALYVPIDISPGMLHSAAARLSRQYPLLEVLPVCADFTGQMPAVGSPGYCGRRVVYFPGSTIGNFTPAEAVELLRRSARLCGPRGALLLGADLKKEPHVLHAAYNDSEGRTAAFNKNLLVRINRELAGDLQPEQFWHHAFYHCAQGRIEMHLVSSREQRVRIGGACFRLAEGESIRTEYSYKYSLADLRRLGAAAGFAMRQVWTDERRYFSVSYLIPTG